jgi:hypothetical protein
VSTGPLGRLEPTDWEHVDKYPLRALAAAEQPEETPVIIGVNWYEDFDAPIRIGNRWWVGLQPARLGRVRGGHCVAMPPKGHREPRAWWLWHNQISEGICVSEGCARAMAWLNGRRYQPRPLYDWAVEHDEFPGDPGGTSVRAGLDCVRTLGMVPARRGEEHVVTRGGVSRPFELDHGISANRWATSIDEVKRALGRQGQSAMPFANSWGDGYPPLVWMPDETYDRLLQESGEFGLVTDR